MAQKVIVPRMGQTMTEGVVAEFHVKEGDDVKKGAPIYEMEYDKATTTVEAKCDGKIHIIASEGDTIPVGGIVAVILEGNESLNDLDPSFLENAKVADSQAAPSPAIKEEPKEEKKEETAEVTPVISNGNFSASPLAKKLADKLGVAISNVIPADGRRIVKADVRSFFENMPKNVSVSYADQVTVENMTTIRKAISKKMLESHTNIPSASIFSEADMSALNDLRASLNAELSKSNMKLTMNDLFIKIVASALNEFPLLNASVKNDKIEYHSSINVGFAFAAPNGLIVPVVKNADKKSLKDIAQDTNSIKEKVNQGRISGEDMQGGTFSISNLGMTCVDVSVPIINAPEAAILGIGRTVKKPVVVNDQIVIRPMMGLSLTFDHRAIDGMLAAEFLGKVVSYIEKPYTMMLN